MEYTSSPNASSGASSPISIGWPSSPSASSTSSSSSAKSSSSSFGSSWSQTSSSSVTSSLTCAFPSWPVGNNLSSMKQDQRQQHRHHSHYQNQAPNSYISDFDLFPEDLDDEASVPFLHEAPAPPRAVPVAPALPLPPLYAQPKPKKRRRSTKKQQQAPKPMTPIAESPEAPE